MPRITSNANANTNAIPNPGGVKQQMQGQQRKGILTIRMLENQRDRGNKKQEQEVAALQNDTQKGAV